MLGLASAMAAPPSFSGASTPAGWDVVRGELQKDKPYVAQNDPRAPLKTKMQETLSLPVEVTTRFQLPADKSFLRIFLKGEQEAAPLLEVSGRMTLVRENRAREQVSIVARASGKPMVTQAAGTGHPWRNKRAGWTLYSWRFLKPRNVWAESDRAEIGSDYEKAVHLAEKTLTCRMTVTKSFRQIWMDGRMVAEERIAANGPISIEMDLHGGSRVLSFDTAIPEDHGKYRPLNLTHFFQCSNDPVTTKPLVLSAKDGSKVPVRMVTDQTKGDIDLGKSLFRNRLGALERMGSAFTFPSPFRFDPALHSFRVPYRAYRNIWLTAWVDDEVSSIPRGAVRFFCARVGRQAATHFEISGEAIAEGKVIPLSEKTADPSAGSGQAGKTQYLVKVPVNVEDLYGLSDQKGQLLDLQLTKPLALMRSYPDPYLYGTYPAGLPSSIHVTGITLEEGALDYEVVPAQFAHVFAHGEKVEYRIPVENRSAKDLQVDVTLEVTSHDRSDRSKATRQITVPTGETRNAELALQPRKYGWYELKVRLEANGEVRGNTLSFVTLPPHTRTDGFAMNETRFGIWEMWSHYVPARTIGGDDDLETMLRMFRKLGLRGYEGHTVLGPNRFKLLKKHKFVSKGPHTINSGTNLFTLDVDNDPEGLAKAVAAEVNGYVKPQYEAYPDDSSYFYGGEWGPTHETNHGVNPYYVGQPEWSFNEADTRKIKRHITLWTAMGRALRKEHPKLKLFLQWGGPQGSVPYMMLGMPKELVDGYGMDLPVFEVVPESMIMNSINNAVWPLRQEVKRLGWPDLPIRWIEGPFLPTRPGALTEDEQADYQVRNLLVGMVYGIERFESALVPFDCGNDYGREHYGDGIFREIPLLCPKPAVAAVNTMTEKLCGADVDAPVNTGCLTTYCLGFRREKKQDRVFALWRVRGTVRVELAIKPRGAVTLTDAMGNATALRPANGKISLTLSSSPVWLEGVDEITSVSSDKPVYTTAPAKVTRAPPTFTAGNWSYDGREDQDYAGKHFGIYRTHDSKLTATFGAGEAGYPDAVAVTLPVEPANRPLARRYGKLKPKAPIVIPGKASALGMWVKGNSSWGRIAYRLRDARGELWTSTGTRDQWNCDDQRSWTELCFESWRYLSFPLPGNAPWDSFREMDTVWWGSDKEGVVDLPLTLEAVFVEARNEAIYLGKMTTIPDRTYKLAGLRAEYLDESHAGEKAVARYSLRKKIPDWKGPQDNRIETMRRNGTTEGPEITGFEEPGHWADGRRMHIRFKQEEGYTYHLYLSLYPDGRGAERIHGRKWQISDNDLIFNLVPERALYLFLTRVDKAGKESKPSKPFKLITHDHFMEK